MGGCAASRLGIGEEDEAVGICRERKRLMKSAVARRCALADAHSRYVHSLYTFGGAISLFVARHSSPAHFLITLPSATPPSSSAISEPSFLRQTPTEPKTETAIFRWSRSPSSSSSSSASCEGDPDKGGGNAKMDYRCFYEGNPRPMPSPVRTFGWDFFDPFDSVRVTEEASAMVGLHRSSEEDLRAVREEEGIPELEEESSHGECLAERSKRGKLVSLGTGEENNHGGKIAEPPEKSLSLLETPGTERQLLDALRDVVDHFIRAYDSGKEVSRMLEANTLDPNAGVEEKKDNSSKLVQAITWHRSPSTQSSSSSSYKSFLASSSKDSSWADGRSTCSLFDDFGGMASGSHSLTLERLYAWEKKLYDEVKSGDRIRRIYERQCSKMTTHNAKGVDSRSVDKTKSAAKDMYTRIWVALKSVETMSQRIEKLRDEELEPQLIELLKGMTETWRIMLESHEAQNRIMLEVNAFTCPAYGKFSTNLHRNATVQLLSELQNWRACFQNYLTAQKDYVEAIHGWLSKFMAPEVGFSSRSRASAPPYKVNGPKILLVCQDWLTSLQKLPDTSVNAAMKTFCRDLRSLCAKQDEEQQQKRKVDIQAKELDKTELSLQRAENRILDPKHSEIKAENDVWHKVEGLQEKKERIEMLRARLESEKAKHHDCMQETQRVALNGFKSGLVNVFDALADFSRDSLKLYNTLSSVTDRDKPGPLEVNEEKTDCR